MLLVLFFLYVDSVGAVKQREYMCVVFNYRWSCKMFLRVAISRRLRVDEAMEYCCTLARIAPRS